MASTLSPSAIHHLICILLERQSHRPRWYPTRVLRSVNSKWKAVYELYMNLNPAPPLDYLDSLELALILKGEADDVDVRAIFSHGKPLEFLDCPRLLVSKIVEAFRELTEEPQFLDMRIITLPAFGAMRPSETWPQVYTSYLPCYACTTVETVERPSLSRARDFDFGDPFGTVDFVVEKFHVSSKSFRKRLTVELHYKLERTGTQREQSSFMHTITIRLADETCPAQGRLSVTANRTIPTRMLLTDFASEVYGFLDRAHAGPSLLANRGLHDRIRQLKQRLPVHHVTCVFEETRPGRGWPVECWLVIRHRQRSMSYTDVRRFEMPSTAGAVNDCTLIRHYLSNSHVADMLSPSDDFAFSIKMLADLASRNCLVGLVQLSAKAERLADYRSMDAVFGGLRMSDLYLGCEEDRFVELVKTTYFFRMSTVRKLRLLRLTLVWAQTAVQKRDNSYNGNEPRNDEPKLRGNTGSKSPLWVSGIYLLRKCEHYRVDYGTDRHMKSIGHKMVQICEAFERGSITDTVEHFQFSMRSSKEMKFSFSADNRLVSGMKAEGQKHYDRISKFEWDVYRFRNAITGKYLTACVGQHKSPDYKTEYIVHILRGEAYPDDTFADY
ncbi:hypothetical protein AAVH_11925 [Aphelenchoides avenae]|nr:hypothetical protein AAVH_11925 [Aphelenchus avenae]